jgi:hypothetical protein
MNNCRCHAEAEYQKTDGTWVHSDICPPQCLWSNMSEEHKKYLHDCLDEWLSESNGSGQFYIENEGFRDRQCRLPVPVS